MIQLSETLPRLSFIDIDQICRYSQMEFIGEAEDSYRITAIYYKKNQLKSIIYIILVILTLGLIYLFQRWFIKIKLALQYTQCELKEMTHVLVVKTKTSIQISKEQLCQVSLKEYPFCQYAYSFDYQLCHYYINGENANLYQLRNSFSDLTQEQILSMTGITNYQNDYGKNIMEIPVKPISQLLLDEILTPFNIFQIAALILWAYDKYLYYSVIIFVITMIQIYIELIDLRQRLKQMRELIRYNVQVQVNRNNTKQIISSINLIPCDLLYIHANTKITCDCILIEGQCTMNEAVLTGESIPISKFSLENNQQKFTQRGNEKRMLFCGTTCLQSSSLNGECAKAIVYQTGFQTMKGSLARYILFNKSQTFSFYKDSLKYIFVLSAIGLVISIIILFISEAQGVSIEEAVINALEIITIIVPPTLPTALGAGISLAIRRLEKQGIHCIKPDKVNVASKINLMAFDKTGTLTELGLDVMGCRESKNNLFVQIQQTIEVTDIFHQCLSVCHQLSVVEDNLMGDPIDLVMFKNTNSIILESDIISHRNTLSYIIKRLEFTPELQRMSVILNNLLLFCKGSPESIKQICIEVPDNYDSMLKRYSSKGYRVIACCYRDLNKNQKLLDLSLIHKRELYENNMIFLGFVLFENRIKVQSNETIKTLSQSNIKSIMVTGDNPYTACNIGIECGILNDNKLYLGQFQGNEIKWVDITPTNEVEDSQIRQNEDIIMLTIQDIVSLGNNFQLIITGDVFEQLQRQYIYSNNKEQILWLLNKTYVFARMKPNNKGDLMLMLKQDKINFIGFCGDGTNDAYALRQADVALALSTEDASLASPFSSNKSDILSVVDLIREGRACLVTCVECFKFMTLYSCIQSMAVLQCYFYDTDFTQSQYLYFDLWMILPLAFVMDLTKAHKKLATYRPISNLLSIPVFSSILAIIIICFIEQIIMYSILIGQQFYVSSNLVDEDYSDEPNYVNTILVYVAGTQTIAVGIAYTQGPPFREPINQNSKYVIVVIILLIGHTIVLFYPQLFNIMNLEVDSLPSYFKWLMFGINILLAMIIIIYEKIVTTKLNKRYAESELNLSIV